MTQVYHGFWDKLPKPIIGLAPMDGVTDFAFRHMAVKYGRPDVVFTEFATADGLFHAPEKIMRDFEYSEAERPVVAQIYGSRPKAFYRAVHVICDLGFDGVDINMGCPSKQVTQKFCGGRLIEVPELALEIIRSVRKAIDDWTQGQTLADLKIPEHVIAHVAKMNAERVGYQPPSKRQRIPYSVKTRIGLRQNTIESWMEALLTESPAVITIHGRTLKQMYQGASSWEAIRSAVHVARNHETLILGNGDITSLEKAQEAIRDTGVDGVLIGRASIGNPWVFRKHDSSGGSLVISREERIRAALEHATYFAQQRKDGYFQSIRKHLSGYLKGFPEAAITRHRAMQTKNLEELTTVLG